ncbi:phage tail protein [Loigolactobacillus binensis]|uniref:Phage tail protein n=1 Tax=Loigolactobacillus binensis TaxID=2559922 RepID=A0ABW3EE02_9LACO|nr:phage tail protein [Loigolactobacillus binensis]
MAYKVDFKEVATTGLESSPVAAALAGLRANEARYFWNKFKHEFVTVPAAEDPATLKWIETILAERDMHFPYKALEVTSFEAEGTKFAYVFYENGLAVNIMYGLAEGSKRAVGFKLSDGMEIPAEFAGKFKFARQRSKLAGTIRGSFFVIKGNY